MTLKILSGGAAQGLANALAPRFKAETGCGIDGTFGAVGAMRDKLLGGAPADLLILTAALIAELERSGHVLQGSARAIGTVHTGIAVRAGDPRPAVGDANALRAALLASDGIYVPDMKLSTAGIHVAKVLRTLGIEARVAPYLREFPNGATAMKAMAAAGGRSIGCTQVTEIMNTPGVTLIANLPQGLELATVYMAGVCAHAARHDLAARFASLLADASKEQARFGFSA